MSSSSYPLESGRPKLSHWYKIWKKMTYINVDNIESLGKSTAIDNI